LSPRFTALLVDEGQEKLIMNKKGLTKMQCNAGPHRIGIHNTSRGINKIKVRHQKMK
jgi:hypothetical protein